VRIAFQTANELGIVPCVEVLLITVSGVNLLVVFPEFIYKVVSPIIIFGPDNAPTVRVFVFGLYLKSLSYTGVPAASVLANHTTLAALSALAVIPE
jgi:hypothetical protein